ncbi:hypothetical protein, partial [Xanthomonas hortorum]|uniref:hypothetical protein n=1 Tax=Xanthomonas hortorum TaxID=56454 RepID=UPI001594983E
MTAHTLPTANELKETFNLFLNRCIELLAEVDQRKELFVFSAVNAQICLELFLKYYYFRLNRQSEVLVTKNGVQSTTFNEFQQIINHFFATSRVNHTSKKELERIGRLRNSIVHRAQDASYQEDLCQSIVATLYFVHAISVHDLDEPVIVATEFPQRVQKLLPWRRAAISFASKICEKPAVCLHCGEAAVVSGEVLTFEPATTGDDVVCLCCLSYLEVAMSVALLRCIDCCEMAVYIDRLNPQERGSFPAKEPLNN